MATGNITGIKEDLSTVNLFITLEPDNPKITNLPTTTKLTNMRNLDSLRLYLLVKPLPLLQAHLLELRPRGKLNQAVKMLRRLPLGPPPQA